MIREILAKYLCENSKIKQQAHLLLVADDEKEILAILDKEDFTSNSDFKNKHNL